MEAVRTRYESLPGVVTPPKSMLDRPVEVIWLATDGNAAQVARPGVPVTVHDVLEKIGIWEGEALQREKQPEDRERPPLA